MGGDEGTRAHGGDRVAALRVEYELGGLSEADLAQHWLSQFSRWFDDAVSAGLVEPNAMVLATASRDGVPSVRTVLLKRVDEGGFTFFTHYTSRKGTDLAGNPRASLLFGWHPIQRQVVVGGPVVRTTAEESDAYWAARPWGSRIGALASAQSRVIADRQTLEAEAARLAARYPEGGDVPRPSTWGGYRVEPSGVEFWQGRRDRLHDRLRYRRDGDGWVVERLAP
ncbi:MAG TPA: pyridoxamine 5'-phosphate oxidase [Cryptosporangiaceae bacterium]|nr:pyridoxamine 5'-phosphate oxidase [Cryptosporangiaceae bacterium]